MSRDTEATASIMLCRLFGSVICLGTCLITTFGVVIGGVGCSQSKDAEVKQLRAEVERLHTQVDARRDAPASHQTALPTNPGPRVPSTSQLGTLRVVLKFDNYVYRLGQPGPWLYIDRKLVRRVSITNDAPTQVVENLSVVPGTYIVEAVAAGIQDHNYQLTPFALSLQSAQVRVEPGAEVVVQLTVTPGLTVYQQQNVAEELFAVNAQHIVRNSSNYFQDQAALYAEDPIVAALRNTAAQLKSRRAEKPTLLLDIPEKYGGPREVDAAQVSVIVDWVKAKYWGKWYSYSKSPFATMSTQEPVVTEAYRLLRALDERVKLQIDQIDEFKGIARRLDEAASRN